MRREEGMKQRKLQRMNQKSCANPDPFPVDLVQIEIINLTFRYAEAKAFKVAQPPLLRELNMKFEQGKLHAICGPPNQGKATLLKVIGQIYLPQENNGFVFVPPHLRVLHLSREKFLIHGSFLENLLMNTPDHKVGGKQRVRNICEMLHFESGLLSHLDDYGNDAETQIHPHTLSDTTWCRLNLARAFVMNPEVLVCHKPAAGFSDKEVQPIMDMLRLHCEEKGLSLEVLTRKVRRPRTVFFTTITRTGVNSAHEVFRMCKETGLTRLDKKKDELTMEDLS
jgi:energy-coupling factor transporter ATP-binding protein EcfA2